MNQTIECGKIINTHGIAGEVKIDSYCDEGFFRRISRISSGSETFEVLSSRSHKGFVLARLQGINTVEDAMRLKGKAIFADRSVIGCHSILRHKHIIKGGIIRINTHADLF